MILIQLVTFYLIVGLILCDGINNKKFPDGFMFGVATAAYQVEEVDRSGFAKCERVGPSLHLGAWNESGKGPQIWDTVTHAHPDFVVDKTNADVACDSYHKLKEDVEMLKSLGVSHYRFSISWSRILPTGFKNYINPAGVRYYMKLIEELRTNNIEPFITLYHWDLPQPLQDLGGWTNPLIVDWVTDYARVCFELLGVSVKYWITFNEPKQVCHSGYGKGTMPPLIKSPQAELLCAHHVLLSHAEIFQLYNTFYRNWQNGTVGIAIDSAFFQPETNKTEDIEAAETAHQFTFGWFANAIVHGDYPSVMKEHISRRSKAAGFEKSLLPEFSEQQRKYIRNTLDFIGVNVYTANVARAINYTTKSCGWQDSMEVDTYQPSSWKNSSSSFLKVTPWSMRGLLKWVSKTYNGIPIIITENGVSENGSTLKDDIRLDQIKTYLSSLRDAMEYDKINVFGYTHWSLMDNFEWASGYSEKFGIYRVDFTTMNRTRIPKDSFNYYKQIIKSRCLIDICTE